MAEHSKKTPETTDSRPANGPTASEGEVQKPEEAMPLALGGGGYGGGARTTAPGDEEERR